jgi:hypothetical protein
MSVYADTTVPKGKGTCVLFALTAPINWGNGIPFIVFVDMAKAPIPLTTYYDLANDTRKIYSFRN